MSKLLTGTGKAGGGGDSEEFMGSDAKEVGAALKEHVAHRTSIVETRAEVLAGVQTGALSREEAEGRLRDLLAKEDRARRSHLFPIGEDLKPYLAQAKGLIERRLHEEAPLVDDPEAILAKYLVFLRCKRAQTHQGIRLLVDPRGCVVGPKDWIASYKPKTDDSKDGFWRGEILCQECLRDGVKERLPYEWVDYDAETWTPNLRHVWKVPKDYATFELEGASRLANLVYDAANIEKRRLDRQIAAREGQMKAQEAARG